MEKNSCLHDRNVDHLAAQSGVSLRRVLSWHVEVGNPVSGIFDEEGDEEAGHEDGGCYAFVADVSYAWVGKHEAGVGVQLFKQCQVSEDAGPKRCLGCHGGLAVDTYMDEGGRDNNAGAELLKEGQDDVELGRQVHG